MKPFSSLPAVALALLPSIVGAIELPPANCGADKLPPIIERGERVTRSWCVVYEEAAVLSSTGITKEVAGTTASCENCPPSCGEPEAPKPREITCKLTLETSFENKKELTVTGGINGGADWIANIEASLEVASGFTETIKPTISLEAKVTVGPCEWQDVRGFQRVCVGKQSRVRIKCQPCWLVTKISNGRSYEYHGRIIEGTATLTCDMAINGTMSIKTTANGRCPRP
jgi:hypothetical protein